MLKATFLLPFRNLLSAAWIMDQCYLAGLFVVIDMIADHLELEELCWVFDTATFAQWTCLSSKILKNATWAFAKKIVCHQRDYWDDMFSDYGPLPHGQRFDFTSAVGLDYPVEEKALDWQEVASAKPASVLRLLQDSLDLISSAAGKFKERLYIDCLDLGPLKQSVNRMRTNFNPVHSIYTVTEQSILGASLGFVAANLPGKNRNSKGQIIYKASPLEPNLKHQAGYCVTSWSPEGTHLAAFCKRTCSTLLIKFYRYYQAKNTLREITGVNIEVELFYFGSTGRASWIDDCTFLYPGYKASRDSHAQLHFIKFSKEKKEVIQRVFEFDEFSLFSSFKGFTGAVPCENVFFAVRSCEVFNHCHDIIQFYRLNENSKEETQKVVHEYLVPGYVACYGISGILNDNKIYFLVRGPRHRLVQFEDPKSEEPTASKCRVKATFAKKEILDHHCSGSRQTLRIFRLLEVDVSNWTTRFLTPLIPGCGSTLTEICDKYELTRLSDAGIRPSLEVSEKFVTLQTDDRRTIHVSREFNFWIPAAKYVQQTLHPKLSLYSEFKKFSKHGLSLNKFYLRRCPEACRKKKKNSSCVHLYTNRVQYKTKIIKD